jgi:NAD(P)-dependent dehydrogenase (short-subunit alcohol dehydrogenase family)
MTFEGKTIVITGAGGNFGREGCIFFAQQNAKIAAFDVNMITLEETSKLVKAKVPNAQIILKECNVTDVSSVQAAVDSIVEEFGSIDLLWNNAGYQGQIKVYTDNQKEKDLLFRQEFSRLTEFTPNIYINIYIYSLLWNMIL